MLPFVSIIVITKNNSSTIAQCIDSLLGQKYPAQLYEIVFVDGNSKDGTDKIIKAYINNYRKVEVKLLYEDKGTMGYARNVGIRHAKGDIVLFTDADAFCPEDWIKRIVMEFKKDRGVLAVGGNDIMVSRSKMAEHEVFSLLNSWKRSKRLRGVKAAACIKTVNFAVRKSVALSINGFDCNLSHLDETEFLARLVAQIKTDGIVYDPTIVVYHVIENASFKSRAKRILKKSIIGTQVLFRKDVLKLALANPQSYIGTSLFIILACFAIPLLLIAAYVVGKLLETFMFLSFFYVICLLAYTVLVRIKKGKFKVGILPILTLDITFRFIGTLIGILKWIIHHISLPPKKYYIKKS